MAKLRPDNLYWRTRGRHWGHNDILRPTSPDAPWWLVAKGVFGGRYPGDGQWLARGVLNHAGGKYPFAAAVVVDPSLRDDAERRIIHELIWLYDEDVGTDLPAWDEAFLESVRDAFLPYFQKEELDSRSLGKLRKDLADALPRSDVGLPAGNRLAELGEIDAPSPEAGHRLPAPPSSAGKPAIRQSVLWALIGALIAVVIYAFVSLFLQDGA